MKDEKFLHLKPEGGILRHGSLFSGIGGFDLAAEWMGWENVFHCEWNEFGQKILKYYWPNAISYTDITKTDFSIHRGEINILTGGFPCQPYSAAGKRLGKEDDRHLWPEMLRAIREIQPTYIVAENVRGLTNWNGGMVFNEVQADMEVEGYQVTPFLLPACAVNAPHRRDRIWFVAHANGSRSNRTKEHENGHKDCGNWEQSDNTNNDGQVWRSTSDTRLQRQTKRKKQTAGFEQCDKRDASNTKRSGSEGEHQQRQGERESGRCHSKSNGVRWQNFPTQSPICSGDDGLSGRLDGITFPKWRNESIKALGNAIVPQVAFEIFRAVGVLNAKTYADKNL